jgi:hypothetical protein
MRNLKYNVRTITIFLLVSAIGAFGADWEAVRHLTADQKIEVTTLIGQRSRGTFVSATADNVVIRAKSGERSIAQKDVRRVRVYDPARRIRKGVMWTVIGAGLGAGAGVAACPGCPNEGHASPYIGPGAAGGAALGALGFLSDPYRTIYSHK